MTTAADGKNYATKFYNIHVIISVGYRVKGIVVLFGIVKKNSILQVVK